MTLIVWDGKTLAADRQSSGGVNGSVTKLFSGGTLKHGSHRRWACALTGFNADCLYNQNIILHFMNSAEYAGVNIPGLVVNNDDSTPNNVSTVGLLIVSDTVKDRIDFKCYTIFANGALELCEDPFTAAGAGYAVSVATGCLHTLNTLSAVNPLRAAMCDSGAAFAIKTAAQYCDGVSYACDTYYCETQTVKRHN